VYVCVSSAAGTGSVRELQQHHKRLAGLLLTWVGASVFARKGGVELADSYPNRVPELPHPLLVGRALEFAHVARGDAPARLVSR
jgi:hypothetical protein